MTLVCRACGAEVAARERIGRRDTCDGCGADLHSCRQCRFYDATAYNECREPQAERVLDKQRANFCDFFAPHESGAAAAARTAASTPSAAARTELDRLFRRR